MLIFKYICRKMKNCWVCPTPSNIRCNSRSRMKYGLTCLFDIFPSSWASREILKISFNAPLGTLSALHCTVWDQRLPRSKKVNSFAKKITISFFCNGLGYVKYHLLAIGHHEIWLLRFLLVATHFMHSFALGALSIIDKLHGTVSVHCREEGCISQYIPTRGSVRPFSQH